MKSAISSLNLRPQERRLIAFVAIVLFVVLNIWLVWPHFGDWGKFKMKQLRARRTLDLYRAEIAKTPGYRVKLRQLESAGSSVVLEEQDLDLVRHVDNQARLNRLTVIQSDPRPRVSADTQTNRFFEEQYLTLHVTSGNEEMVNFLVSLTSTNSMIRVKDLTLKTDPGVTKLDGHMTLVASYQRTPSVRPAAATAASTPARAPSPPATAAAGPAAKATAGPTAAPLAGPTGKPAAANPAAGQHTAATAVVSRLPSRIPRPIVRPALSNRTAAVTDRLTNQFSKKP